MENISPSLGGFHACTTKSGNMASAASTHLLNQNCLKAFKVIEQGMSLGRSNACKKQGHLDYIAQQTQPPSKQVTESSRLMHKGVRLT